MNFIPKEEIQKQQYKRLNFILIVFLVIQLPLFIDFVFYKPYIEIQSKQRQLQLLNQKLESPNYQTTLQKLALVEQLSQDSEPKKRQQWITKSLANTFFENLSKDMGIETLEMVEQQVIVKGRANEIVAILEYQKALEEIFGSGYVSSLFEPTQGVYTYEIVVQIKETDNDL